VPGQRGSAETSAGLSAGVFADPAEV
jgi:hypothetical protein